MTRKLLPKVKIEGCSLSAIKDKTGEEVGLSIRIFRGYDANGERLTPVSEVFHYDFSVSEKANISRLRKQATELIRRVARGEIIPKKEQREQAKREELERKKNPTFSEYVEKYMVSRQLELAPQTIAHMRGMFSIIGETFGEMKLAEIKPMDIREYIDGLRVKGKAFGTVSEYYSKLHTLFNKAVEDEVIEVSPMDKVKKPRKNKNESLNRDSKSFTADEVQYIFECLETEKPMHKVLIRLGIDSGCRCGEMLALRWKDINLNTGECSILHSVQYLTGEGASLTTPKNGETRSIRLSATMCKILKDWRTIQSKELQGKGLPLSEFVLHGKEGGLLTLKGAIAIARRIGERHGIKNLHLHKLRHTWATLAEQNGLDIVSISKWLGHKNLTTTMIYLHGNPNAIVHARECMDKAIYKEGSI